MFEFIYLVSIKQCWDACLIIIELLYYLCKTNESKYPINEVNFFSWIVIALILQQPVIRGWMIALGESSELVF